MTERPNKKALEQALDMYRDAMRPFIVRCLKRVRGRTVEGSVMDALHDDQYHRFERNLDEGRSVAEAIDINNFPWIVRFYWQDLFRSEFRSGRDLRNLLHSIAEVRNKVSHPEEKDIELKDTLDSLDDITHVLAAINEPEQSQAVANIRDALKPFTTPAHRFFQGGREVYAFALDLETLDKLLPDRVDESVVKDANRPLTPSHAERIQDYLRERPDWLLGTLLLGIAPDAVDFEPYSSESGIESSVGQLTFRAKDADHMRMFDGQHRRRAIEKVLRDLSHNTRHARKLSSLKEASLPIMLYAEDNIEALQQMFVDAAQTRPIEGNAVAQFDQRDAFNLTALSVAADSDLFSGRVEMNRPSVARSNPNIIAINQLAVALKALEVGYRGRVSKERNDRYMLDLESLQERCLEWADDFMPAARDEYNNLMVGEVDNSDIPSKRAETMCYNATVIRIFAGCYHEWTKESGDWSPLADYLRSAKLRPGESTGSLLVDAGVVAPGGTSPSARQSLVVDAIDHIVFRAKEARG